MNAVETVIMQTVLKSVKDFNKSFKMLTPGVTKYFKDHYDEDSCSLDSWRFIGDGDKIEMSYTRLGTITTSIKLTDVVQTETIVKLAVELAFNKN